ncbi:hypothetical protein ACFX2J_043915 [Malus domestica]
MYPDVPPGGAVAYPTRPGYRKFGDVRATQLIVEVAAARDQHHYDGGPFCFFKPTKPESLMAIFGIIWGSQNSFPVPIDEEQTTFIFLKFSYVFSSCRNPTAVNLTQKVDFTFPKHFSIQTPEVASKKINREVIKQFVLLCKESQLGKRMPAYGGMKSIYTAGPLPVASKDSVVKLAEKDGPGVFVLPMAAQAHLPPPMAQASAPGGPAPAQASSSSATAPPPSSSKRHFCFFKPCKPESLMAFLDPKIIWLLKTPFRFLLTKSKQPFIFLKFSHVYSSCRIPTVNLTQKVDFLRL